MVPHLRQLFDWDKLNHLSRVSQSTKLASKHRLAMTEISFQIKLARTASRGPDLRSWADSWRRRQRPCRGRSRRKGPQTWSHSMSRRIRRPSWCCSIESGRRRRRRGRVATPEPRTSRCGRQSCGKFKIGKPQMAALDLAYHHSFKWSLTK